MRILNDPEKPEIVEIHLSLTRYELQSILNDIESGDVNEKAVSYAVTDEFMAYLRSL